LKSPQIQTCLAWGAFKTKAALTVPGGVGVRAFSAVTAFSGGFGEGGCVKVFGDAAAAVGRSLAIAADAIDCLGKRTVVGVRGASGFGTSDGFVTPAAIGGFCPEAPNGVAAFRDALVAVNGGLGAAAPAGDSSGSCAAVSGFRLPGSTRTGFLPSVSAARVPGALVNGFFGMAFLVEFSGRISRKRACGVASREQGKRKECLNLCSHSSNSGRRS